MASLWTVDDGGTQVLMDAFYARLKKGNLTKIEALQQAQIALMKNDRSLNYSNPMRQMALNQSTVP
ncbi:CHAT domain-containing protein [Phormidesmis sp. 146-12]